MYPRPTPPGPPRWHPPGRVRARSAALLLMSLLATYAVVATPAAAAPTDPTTSPTTREAMPDGPVGGIADQPAFPDGYVQRVQTALRQGTDAWGEQLMALPDGPTLANTRDLLVPPSHGDDFWHDTRSDNLPLTYPMPNLAKFSEQRDFSFHFTDGSQINSDFADNRTRQWVKFYVGDGSELYGSAETRLAEPALAEGYQPVLQNSYTDGQGRVYERESLVTRFADSDRLMSMVRFTVRPGNSAQTSATLRVNLNGLYVAGAVAAGNNLKVGDKLSAAYSGTATWTAPDLTWTLDLSGGQADVYLLLMNQPQALGTVVMDRSGYDTKRAETIAYWKKQLDTGTDVQIPEKYAADAMRSMLLTNLVMGYNLTVGNRYELPDDPTFAWIPEVVATLGSIGDY